MSRMQASVTWVKHTLSWSNSAESWIERLVGAAIVVAAVGLWLAGTRLTVWQNIALWAVLAITAGILLRRGWLKLFGPVLFYDMLCTARRGRYFLVRSLYTMLLLMVLGSVWLSTQPFNRQSPRDQAASIAMHYFEFFTLVQMIAVVLLTPSYVAGAIAEEKERKTLEFLLATDLRNREIILSKFGSRLSNLALFLLTGLPILSFLQFLGGVDPDLVLASFAATGMTAVGLASLSILNSTVYRRPRDAIAMTYLMLISYFAVASVLFVFKMAPMMTIFQEPIWFGDGAPTIGDAVEVLNAGNAFVALGKVAEAGRIGTLATVIPTLLWHYFLFHAALAVVCLTWSVVRLRALALKQSYGRANKVRWHQRYRPPVGDLPVLWKEMIVEGTVRINWAGWIAVILLVLLTIGIGCWIVIWFFWDVMFNPNAWHGGLVEPMNVWCRVAGTGVGVVLLLGVAVRASTTIRSEMDKDTFDALVTTPLAANAILLGKFIGCVFSVRLGWFWLGSILGLALLTGGLHILALPLFLGAWMVYAVVFAMIGLWFSMVCKTTMRATVYTMLTTIGVSVGHWMIWMCCLPLLIFMDMRGGGINNPTEYFMKFQVGMTPPAVMGIFAYCSEDLSHGFGPGSEFPQFLGFSLLGLFLWTMAALMLWFVLIVPRFRHLTRRDQSSSELE
jgi:ABC-type transport system involved in multi-copper enzyme maturation permease subunit